MHKLEYEIFSLAQRMRKLADEAEGLASDSHTYLPPEPEDGPPTRQAQNAILRLFDDGRGSVKLAHIKTYLGHLGLARLSTLAIWNLIQAGKISRSGRGTYVRG